MSALFPPNLPHLGYGAGFRIGISLISILLLLLIVQVAHSRDTLEPGESPGRIMTLKEVKETAFRNNWDLISAKSDVDSARTQMKAADEIPNPNFSFSTAHIPADPHSGNSSPDSSFWGRYYDSIASVTQLIEIGGKRKVRHESAAQLLKGSEARLDNQKRLLSQSLTRAYIASILAEESVVVLNQTAESLKREADIAQRRFKAGDISYSDQTQIEISADRVILDAETAKANALAARISVETVMGARQPNGKWKPAESLDELLQILSPAEEPVKGLRPDLIAAETALQKAESDLKLQKAMRVPDPTLMIQYEHAPPDQSNTIGLGVSFPLPLWNFNRGNIESTEAIRRQAEEQLNRNRSQLNFEIINAKTAYESAKARSRAYRDEILPRSAAILKSVAFAYEKGGASLLDFLSAERTDNDVRLATAISLADAAGAAADLRAALNMTDEGKPNP